MKFTRAAIENMATALTRKGSVPEPVSAADIKTLHSKIGQLVVERGFWAAALQQRFGTRGQKVRWNHKLSIRKQYELL